MADKSARLIVLIEPNEKTALIELARREGVSMGAMVRRLIADATETERA